MYLLRILGQKGRITIPYELREKLDWQEGDVITFADMPDGSITMTREFLCDYCGDCSDESSKNEPPQIKKEITLQECLDDLSEKDQRDALVYLMTKWAANQAGIGR